jgi:hypothetical protein
LTGALRGTSASGERARSDDARDGASDGLLAPAACRQLSADTLVATVATLWREPLL